MRTINRKLPFQAEIPLDARMRVGGDNWNKEGAVVNLLADLLVPGLSASQLALVEPDLDSR